MTHSSNMYYKRKDEKEERFKKIIGQKDINVFFNKNKEKVENPEEEPDQAPEEEAKDDQKESENDPNLTSVELPKLPNPLDEVQDEQS